MDFMKPEVRKIIESKNWTALKDTLSKWQVSEIAEFLSELDKPERVLLFRALSRDVAAEVFSYFEAHEQDALLRDLTDDETRHLMANMAPDDRIGLLEELPAEVTQRILRLLSPDDLAEARKLLGYPEYSAGRLMTPDYLTVRADWTVGRSLDTVRKEGRDRETVNAVYVVDTPGKLVGVVTLRRLVLEDPNTLVEDVMLSPALRVTAFDDREDVAVVMMRYDLSVLPVVDSEGVLVGIVTADDVFEVAQKETTEDFQKGAAVSPLRVGLKAASPLALYRSRIPWLLGLLAVYLVSGTIMSRFEHVISAVVPLVFFLPLLIDSAGNAGSQSAILMVRALGMGDVELKDWAKVFLRELGVSMALGLALGITVFAVGLVNSGFQIAAVVAVTMLTNVVITCLIGVLIPFLLEKFGLDPATASSPLVTSVSDILGVIIYFTVATWCLGI